MNLKLNLNDHFTFKLSESGVRVMQANEYEMQKLIPTREGKTYAVDQEVSMPLWEIVQFFGATTGMGIETFCQEATITFKGRQ